MTIVEFIFLMIAWHILGLLIISVISEFTDVSFSSPAEVIKFVNPSFVYKPSCVNWFGAILLTVLYSLMIPILTACYWFYKLCTVGRKTME